MRRPFGVSARPMTLVTRYVGGVARGDRMANACVSVPFTRLWQAKNKGKSAENKAERWRFQEGLA